MSLPPVGAFLLNAIDPRVKLATARAAAVSVTGRTGLRRLKQIVDQPLFLNRFEVEIEGDADRRLAQQVLSVEIPLEHYRVGVVEQGPFRKPQFLGLKQDLITFTMSFLESKDGYITAWANAYLEKFLGRGNYGDGTNKKGRFDGTVREPAANRLKVSIFQLTASSTLHVEGETQRVIKYSFDECLFKEQSRVVYSQSSTENLIISFGVSASRFEREVTTRPIRSPYAPRTPGFIPQ